MSINRTLIKSGPAIVTWNGATVYFKDGLTIMEELKTFDVNVDTFTGTDKRRDSVVAIISGTPSGQWINLGVLYPWLSAARGARLHGASDKPAVIKFLDGDIFTYHNAGLAEMPDLFLGATKTAFDGKLTLEARTKLNTTPETANSFVTRTSGTFNDTSFSWDDIPTQVYALSWGADPWDSFNSRDGVKISTKLKWSDLDSDAGGVVDRELDGVEVSVSFTPLDIAQSAIDAKLAMQGTARGARLSALAQDFIIEGDGVYVMVRSAVAVKVPLQAGTSGKGRHGTIEAVATMAVTAGAPIAQLYVDTAAPV